MEYDYNYACGFISVGESPVTLESVIVSGLEESYIVPYSEGDNNHFNEEYIVYITILTRNDYEYGGTY